MGGELPHGHDLQAAPEPQRRGARVLLVVGGWGGAGENRLEPVWGLAVLSDKDAVWPLDPGSTIGYPLAPR